MVIGSRQRAAMVAGDIAVLRLGVGFLCARKFSEHFPDGWRTDDTGRQRRGKDKAKDKPQARPGGHLSHAQQFDRRNSQRNEINIEHAPLGQFQENRPESPRQTVPTLLPQPQAGRDENQIESQRSKQAGKNYRKSRDGIVLPPKDKGTRRDRVLDPLPLKIEIEQIEKLGGDKKNQGCERISQRFFDDLRLMVDHDIPAPGTMSLIIFLESGDTVNLPTGRATDGILGHMVHA